jgi:hypothetical protein
MNAPAPGPPCYVFDFPHLDTVVQVAPLTKEVVIRASRSTFSERRKRCFIRELVAEGFIDPAFGWCDSPSPGGVRWVVDPSAFLPDAEHAAETRHFMVRLIFSSIALWLFLMGVMILRAGR